MANEKVAIDLLINAAESARSIKDLKQSVKDLKNAALEVGEGSKDFAKLTSAASQAKDKMDDLNEAIHALNPENLGQQFAKVGSTIAGGFQAAQGAMVLFGQESKDVEKALLKVQAATAFAQGIQSVGDLGKAFKALNLIVSANPIAAVSAAVAALGIAVYELWNNFLRAKTGSEQLTAELDKQKQANELLNISIDNEITALTGLASNEEKIIELKRKKLQITIQEAKASVEIAKLRQKESLEAAKEVSILERLVSAITGFDAQLISAANSANDYSDATGDAAKSTQELEKALADLSQLENQEQQKQLDSRKKSQDDFLKEQEKLDQLKKAARERESAFEFERREFEKSEAEKKEMEFDAQLMRRFEANVEYIDKTKDYELEREFATEQEKLAIAQQSVNSLQSLSDLFFEAKLATLQKGTAAEDRAARNQFKINKALALQSNIISTIMGITNALSAQSIVPEPFGTILKAATAVSVGIAGTANTIKIAKSQYGGGASSVSAPSLSTPSVSANRGVDINPVRSTTSTTIDSEKVESGQSVVRAYVVESDITSKQNSVKNIEQKSKI